MASTTATYGYVRTDTGLAPCRTPRHCAPTIRKTFHVIVVASDVLRWAFLPAAAYIIVTAAFCHMG